MKGCSTTDSAHEPICEERSRAPQIRPPIGGEKKKRGRPRSAMTQALAAEISRVSVRSVQRACAIRRNGVPEIFRLVECGELKLGAAEQLCAYSVVVQRELLTHGAQYVRAWLRAQRRRQAEQDFEGRLAQAEAAMRWLIDRADRMQPEFRRRLAQGCFECADAMMRRWPSAARCARQNQTNLARRA